MTDAVQQPAKAASHADAHPRLYHYTGEHAFKSIVGNNTLWATYFEDLNDASEFKVLRTPLAEELGFRFISTVEAFANRGGWQAETIRSKGGVRSAAAELGKILMNNLYKATFGAPFSESFYPCFVSSFCSHIPWSKPSAKRRREVLIPKDQTTREIRPIRSENRATLVASIARGRRWLNELIATPTANAESIGEREGCTARQVNMTISLAFLAPDLVEAAIHGKLPHGMGVRRLRDLPPEWHRQRQTLGL
jgi:hypothetical protein